MRAPVSVWRCKWHHGALCMHRRVSIRLSVPRTLADVFVCVRISYYRVSRFIRHAHCAFSSSPRFRNTHTVSYHILNYDVFQLDDIRTHFCRWIAHHLFSYSYSDGPGVCDDGSNCSVSTPASAVVISRRVSPSAIFIPVSTAVASSQSLPYSSSPQCLPQSPSISIPAIIYASPLHEVCFRGSLSLNLCRLT